MATAAAAFALPRTWIGGNSSWVDNGSTANWTPADEPDFDDEAIFNTVNAVSLGSSNSISDLTMSGGIDLATNGNQLLVSGATGIAGPGTTLVVDPHATAGTIALQSPDVVVKTGGSLAMNGGIASVSTLLDINAGGTLSGFGTVNVGNLNFSSTKALDNSGVIQVVGNTVAPQTLTIHANGLMADTIDLDGSSENGVVNVDNAVANSRADSLTLVIDGPLSDAFGGVLQIGQRDMATFNDNFTMDGADVQLAGGANVATMNGPGSVTSVVNSSITATGAAVIANNMTLTGAANAVTINADSSLTLAGAVAMPAATLHMAATTSHLIVTGSVAVDDPAQAFDWDGPGFTTTTISGNGFLNITADKVDTGGNGYGGTLNLNDDGDLGVHNTANQWTSSTAINKNNVGTSTVGGASLIVQGALNVNAGTLNLPATTLDNGADVNVAGVLVLGTGSQLKGPATLSGAGTLQIGGTSTVVANTTVNVATFDWDGATTGTTQTIGGGATFTINSAVFDSDGDLDDPLTLAANGSQLIVNGPAQWTATAAINANPSGAGTATIGGTSRLILAGPGAALSVHGGTNITAPLTFAASSVANVDAGKKLAALGGTTYAGGTISGAGTYAAGGTNVVTADTLINVSTFDMDGGTWLVQPGAHLTCHVTAFDSIANSPFGSTLTLDNGAILADGAAAAFVMNGVLNMNAVAGGVAEWSGDAIDVGNDGGTLDAHLNVTGDGNANSQSRIVTPIRFLSDADVEIAAGASLVLTGPATFDTVNGAANAEFTGTGLLSFGSFVQVREAAAFNMAGGTIDLDGDDSTGEFINIDAPLTIHAATVADFGRVNSGGGTNTLDVDNSLGAGVLTVALDNPASEWTLNPAGVLNLVNDNAQATLLAGSALNLNGSLFVTGDVRTTARLDIAGSVSIGTPGEPLRLAGGGFANDNALVGGTINGPGLLGADTGKTLRGFGVINAGVDFDGSAALIADGGMLTVNGSLIDVGTAEALAGGVLNVANAWNTTVADAVLVVGGELKGGAVTIGGAPVVGRGLVSARVVNNVGISGNGGTLVVQTAANDNDWDGAAGSGSLTATGLGSVLELRDNATFGFTGSVNASATGRVFANGFALDFNAGSSLQLQDGAYEATHGTDLGGSVVTVAGATSQSTLKVAANQPLTFEAASVTTLGQNLRLENNSIQIAAGATFGGAGSLVVPDGSRVTTAAGASVNVPLQNDGDLQLSGPAVVGSTVVRDYQQSSAGDLFVDLGGTLFSQYDRLAATGSATLSGALHVNIAGAFSPAIGQTFNVVSATAGRTGQFSLLDVAGMPLGLALRVDYFPTTVQLLVVPAATMAADFNHDGAVDGGDLTVWNQAFGVSGLADANGDGRSDGADFLAWQRGVSGGSPATLSTIAVPEPRGLEIVALLSIAVMSCRHRRGLTAY